MKKPVIVKYSEDDILEILTEYLANEYGFDQFNTKAAIIGMPGENLRLVAIIGDSEDNSIQDMELDEIDKNIEFNGSHSRAEYINPSTFAKIKINDC